MFNSMILIQCYYLVSLNSMTISWFVFQAWNERNLVIKETETVTVN